MKLPTISGFPGLTRRSFLDNSLKTVAGLALGGITPLFAAENKSLRKAWTVQDVINLVLKEGALAPIKNTVDTIKSGNANQQVTGIVTTMFPTITVIEEAVKRNANFIIAHEPSFYNHKDDVNLVKNNSVLEKKLQLLEKHKLVIWRFHDYCHSINPDIISYGVAKKANWLSYYKAKTPVLTIPKISLQQLVQHLKSSLEIKNLRIIGNPDQMCERVALLPGAAGGQFQISVASAEKPDVLIVGEVSEWETAEYIRDSRLLGGNMALIVLGHAVSEEPGMEWFVEWLQPKLPEIKITHIASGNPFTWM